MPGQLDHGRAFCFDGAGWTAAFGWWKMKTNLVTVLTFHFHL